jgi:hypothetical protein
MFAYEAARKGAMRAYSGERDHAFRRIVRGRGIFAAPNASTMDRFLETPMVQYQRRPVAAISKLVLSVSSSRKSVSRGSDNSSPIG